MMAVYYVSIPKQEVYFPAPEFSTNDTYVFVAPELND